MNRRNALAFLLWLAPIVAGLFIGVTLLLTPLPTMDAFGSPIGWCGPGATSTNAVHVLLNPSVVNEDGGIVQSTDPDAQMTLRSYCVGAAKDRVVYAGISVIAGILIGIGLLYCISLAQGRRPTTGLPTPEIRVPYRA